jgi:hypothetical protein
VPEQELLVTTVREVARVAVEPVGLLGQSQQRLGVWLLPLPDDHGYQHG